MTDIQTPQSVDSERALLGAILIDPQIINFISLDPSAFYDVGHQTLYAAMRAIGSRELDLVVLTEVLERKGKLNEVGGSGYITSLMNACPQTYNYEAYERAIKDTATRRHVIRLCERLASDAFAEDKNINDSISKAVSELVHSAKPKGGAVPMTEYMRTLMKEIEERAEDPKEIYGLRTGIIDFDKITSGLQKGEEFILAGLPGTGKSLLAVQMACGMAKNGHPGAIYSLEMKGIALARRQLSNESKIPTYNMRSGVDMENRWIALMKGVDRMAKYTDKLYISDASDWTTLQLRADLSRLIAQESIEFFILDYHDLLKDYVGDSLTERSTYITQQLHAICKDLDMAGLIIQSMNKGGFHQSPTMANLSGSSKVSYTSDNIAFLIADEKEPNVVHLVWDKVREGASNRAMKLVKSSTYPMFGNYRSE